jgi:hypothetical protein
MAPYSGSGWEIRHQTNASLPLTSFDISDDAMECTVATAPNGAQAGQDRQQPRFNDERVPRRLAQPGAAATSMLTMSPILLEQNNSMLLSRVAESDDRAVVGINDYAENSTSAQIVSSDPIELNHGLTLSLRVVANTQQNRPERHDSYPDEFWEFHKERIREYYMDHNLPLREVCRKMRAHGLDATSVPSHPRVSLEAGADPRPGKECTNDASRNGAF